MTVEFQGLSVAVIEPVGGHGGMNYYDFGLCGALAERGVKVVLYTCDETVVPAGLNFECKLFFKGIYGAASKYSRGFRFVWGLLHSLIDARRKKVDIVHVHFFHSRSLDNFVVRLIKFFGLKLVATIHDVESFAATEDASRQGEVFSRADGIICHNDVSLREVLPKVDERAISLFKIPHGNYVGMQKVVRSREEARTELSLGRDAKVLLFFGQIKKVKGLEIFLQALPLLVDRHPGLVVLLAGKVWKDDFSFYQKIIDENGLGDVVRTTIRYISDEEAVDFYAATDAVVLPYRKIYQSGVLLMAMSHGRTVVASNLPGMAEVVTSGVNGFLFASEDSSDLARVLDFVLSNPEEGNRVALNGLDLMKSDYSWSQVGFSTAKAYMKIMGR